MRTATIYISARTAKLLRLVCKLYPTMAAASAPQLSGVTQKSATMDEVADDLLRVSIASTFPLVIDLAKKQEELEKDFVRRAADV